MADFRIENATILMMTRKAGSLDEARRVRLHGENLADADVEYFGNGLIELGTVTQRRARAGRNTHFVAVELDSQDGFLVDTEGYDYPRYVGRLSARDLAVVQDAEWKRSEEGLEAEAADIRRAGGVPA